MAIKRSTKDLISYYNEILSNNNCKHSIIEMSQNYMIFSNSVKITGIKEVKNIKELFEKRIHWHDCLSWWFDIDTSEEKRTCYRKEKKKNC